MSNGILMHRSIIQLSIIVIFIVAAIYLWQATAAKHDHPEWPVNYAGMTKKELWINRPKLFKPTHKYPLQTQEEQELWEWRKAIEAVDPNYEFRMPIEFYGRVLDQNDKPVIDATVEMHWTPRSDSLQIVKTDSLGCFSLKDVNGKLLFVEIHKDGYVGDNQSDCGTFEYTDFYEPNFHVPNQNQPVVFRLWKYVDSERMYKWNLYPHISVDGTPTWIDFEKGEEAPMGDIAFSVKSNAV